MCGAETMALDTTGIITQCLGRQKVRLEAAHLMGACEWELHDLHDTSPVVWSRA